MSGGPHHFGHTVKHAFRKWVSHAGRMVHLITDTWYGEPFRNQTIPYQTLQAHSLVTGLC